jgi:SAM-dependent methyltransferase
MSTPVFDDQFKGNVAKIEMSRYIDLDIYHAVEKSHPFYVEMLAEISDLYRDLCKGRGDLRLLEIGAGTGLATEEFLKHDWAEIVALDIDEECCNLLRGHLGGRVTSICDDALAYGEDGGFDIAASVFAHDHIPSEKVPKFLANIRRNLKSGGTYIVGAEFLPFYQSEDEWREALYRYHGFIVDKALREENFELAQIEISALKSGLYKIGDFKRHERMFEDEMLAAGLTLYKKIKVGPLDDDTVGGIFVYAYRSD